MKEKLKYLLNIQLFADDDETPETTSNTEDETPESSEEDEKRKSYVKIREEKATAKLLKQLGVSSVDEAKEKFNAAEQAKLEAEKAREEFETKQKELLTTIKTHSLTTLLEAEKVFDADALVRYVDINQVELNPDGTIKDAASIINQLKEQKPHYFGQSKPQGDSHYRGKPSPQKDEVSVAYEQGRYVDATALYLKQLKQGGK